jgi:plasmid stability protein
MERGGAESFQATPVAESRQAKLAIIDCSDIIDSMASITIRQLPEETKRKLKIRAAEHGRSMEQEAREILKGALQKPRREQPKDLAEAIPPSLRSPRGSEAGDSTS